MSDPARPIIAAAAGPKGGVGKSCLSLNLAIALAGQGLKTILVDLDLGGANLHALFGLSNIGPGLADFVFQRRPLIDLLRPTGVNDLSFLLGSADTLGMANLIQWQKIKLLSHLKKLPAEVIVADLGSGSSFITLDLYAAAHLRLLVTSPETTSLINAYGFLKSLIFRVFLRIIRARRNEAVLELISRASRPHHELGLEDINGLIVRAAAEDPASAAQLSAVLNNLRPGIILNLISEPAEARTAEALIILLHKRLSLEAELWAQVPFDAAMRRSVIHMKPLLLLEPQSSAAQAIIRLADQVRARLFGAAA